MEAIQAAIESEIERRVQERITKVLMTISENYDIKLDRLLKDTHQIQGVSSSTCCGLTKNKKRCSRPGKFDGYCKIHISQKPDIRSISRNVACGSKHTHSFPPVFLAGCPACENTKLRKQVLEF